MNLLYQALLILFFLYHDPIKKWEGVFCTKAIAEGSVGCYKLYDDGKFTYESNGCLGREYYGSGSFEVGKDSIVFEYGVKQSFDRSKLEITSLDQPAEGDSISLFFEFFSLEPALLPLPGTVLDVDPITKKNIKFYQSGTEGKIEVRKKKGVDPLSLRVAFIGFETVQFSIVPSQNQRIIVHLADYNGTEIFQKRVAYKINHDESISFGTLPWGAFSKRRPAGLDL